MDGLALAAPPVAPYLPPQWQGLQVDWVGPDGAVWDLADPSTGVVLVQDGVEGLHFPPITKFSSSSRAIPGKRIRGWQAASRDVFWPLLIWQDGSEGWLEVQRRFFSTIHPERAGTWRVTANGETRSLELTGVFEDTFAYDHDPVKAGWALYGVALEAAAPYWRGETKTWGPWEVEDMTPFIPDTLAPEFDRVPTLTTANANVPNPGDVDVWPVWKAKGECNDLQLGVGSTVIKVPFDLLTGDVLVIDTDPRHPTATKNGEDATADLGLQDYAQIPPGESVPVKVSFTGAGTVSCTTTPLYFRAF